MPKFTPSLVSHRAGMLTRRAVAISIAAAVTVPLLALPAHADSGFTTGDLVVYRVGTGGAALAGAATAVTLDEYLPAVQNQSTAAFSLPMPTAAGTGSTPNPLTASGSATSEGGISLSTDGSTLLVPGYAAATGVSSIASTTATADPREVGEVDGAGDIDTTSTLGTTAFSGNNPRGAASVNGSAIYAAGAGGTESTQGGVWYSAKGSGTSTLLIGGNYRWANIFSSQLYASSGSASAPAIIGVNKIGSGLPTTTGQTASNLNGVDSSSSGTPYGYYLLSEGGNGIDTAYVADSSGGVDKYSLISGTWTAEGSISSTSFPKLSGVTGLTGTVSGNTVTLYASSPTSLVQIADTVGTGALSGTPIVLATAATDEAFRGVAFAPSGSPTTGTPEAPVVVALPLLALAVIGGGWVLTSRRRRIA
jgi:hypothetical protein